MERKQPCLIYITTGSNAEAEMIANSLVEERLAACCSVLTNIKSFYRWEGKLQRDEECLILCKTTAENFPALENRIRDLHSYETPEIIMVPVSQGSEPYLEWLRESVRNE